METRIVEIAERIKGLREMMDITPEEMAEAAGVELEEYLRMESRILALPFCINAPISWMWILWSC